MAYWKMPEALAPVTAHFDAFGVERACELLEVLGDRAAVPLLEARLEKAQREPERTRIEAAIAKLGGGAKAKPGARGKQAAVVKRPKAR